MQEQRKRRVKLKTGMKLYIGIAGFILLLNILSGCSKSFCDAYVSFVFPIWVNTYGRVTGIFPFSVGEWMILAGILMLCGAVICGFVAAVSFLRKKDCPDYIKKYLRFFAWVLLVVGLVMTLNCTLLYRTSGFAEKYLQGASGDDSADEDSLVQFVKMRNRIASRCNELSEVVERDEKGYIVYPGTEAQMQDLARAQMKALGEEYGQLSGFYPRPKPMFFSDFMCQQDMLGWYFPFSMEANYNYVAYITNRPASLCHELAHLKGYIYEDEANFIGYLACVRSEDPYFEYSGYLSVLGYVESDLRKAAHNDPEGLQKACEGQGLVKIMDQVYKDDIFITQEDRDRIEGKAVLDSEMVSQATDTFLDTTLKVNGVSDGIISYSRVVELMLRYEAAKCVD